jgi:hypothetical protein
MLGTDGHSPLAYLRETSRYADFDEAAEMSDEPVGLHTCE